METLLLKWLYFNKKLNALAVYFERRYTVENPCKGIKLEETRR